MSQDDLKNGAQENADFDELRKQLRSALPAIGQSELRHDLWPDMLRRLERPPIRVLWFDWALLGVAAAAAIFFPALIPALLYHL